MIGVSTASNMIMSSLACGRAGFFVIKHSAGIEKDSSK
jgi:hypothetical protein